MSDAARADPGRDPDPDAARAAAAAPPELLMMERAETMAFAAGALVFPGGRIDPDDHDAAARLPRLRRRAPRGSPRSARRSRRPASRRRCGRRPATPTRRRCATAIAAGEPFAGLLDRLGLALDLDALTPFARWCPNFREARRFDTLFYLAEAPPGGAAGQRRRDRGGAHLLGERRRYPRRDRGRPGQGDLPDPPQPRAARRLRLARRGAGRRRAPPGAADHALGRGAGRPALRLHPRGSAIR